MSVWEKCPVCEGRGTVPGGFYNHLELSCIPKEKCKCCDGEMIILSELPEEIRIARKEYKEKVMQDLEKSIAELDDGKCVTTPVTRQEIKEIGLLNGIEDELLANFCVECCDEAELYNLDSTVRVRDLIELVKDIREDENRPEIF